MNRATRKFTMWSTGLAFGATLMWAANVAVGNWPVQTWWTMPIAVAIGMAVWLLVHAYANRSGNADRYLINLRSYRRNPLVAPSPVPWHVKDLTRHDVDKLIDNRSEAWAIYYERQERRRA